MRNEQTAPRPNGWRARLAPQEHFQRYGRRVCCILCFQWQRTDPRKHAAKWRLREMPCDTQGCDGRLRTVEWWDRFHRVATYNPESGMAGLRQAEGAEETGAAEQAGLVRLDVDMLRLLNDMKADTPKARR